MSRARARVCVCWGGESEVCVCVYWGEGGGYRLLCLQHPFHLSPMQGLLRLPHPSQRPLVLQRLHWLLQWLRGRE
jgi:hypothetical protein